MGLFTSLRVGFKGSPGGGVVEVGVERARLGRRAAAGAEREDADGADPAGEREAQAVADADDGRRAWSPAPS